MVRNHITYIKSDQAGVAKAEEQKEEKVAQAETLKADPVDAEAVIAKNTEPKHEVKQSASKTVDTKDKK